MGRFFELFSLKSMKSWFCQWYTVGVMKPDRSFIKNVSAHDLAMPLRSISLCGELKIVTSDRISLASDKKCFV
jgi:hypothetical protein